MVIVNVRRHNVPVIRAGDTNLSPGPFHIQKRQWMLFCRFRMAFYYTIDPWRCYCFHTCYNMHNVKAQYSFISGNTEYNYDPNNVCVEGYTEKKNMTCPIDINNRVLRREMPSGNWGWLKTYECKKTCRLFPSYIAYYQLTDEFCSCFQTCEGMHPSESSPSDVGLLSVNFDPSIISVDRID